MSNKNSRLRALGSATGLKKPSVKKRGKNLHSRLSDDDYKLLKSYAPNRSKLVRATLQYLRAQVLEEEAGDAKYWIATSISTMKGNTPTRTFSIDPITWDAIDSILGHANSADVADSLTTEELVEADMPKLVAAFLKVMKPGKAVLEKMQYDKVK